MLPRESILSVSLCSCARRWLRAIAGQGGECEILAFISCPLRYWLSLPSSCAFALGLQLLPGGDSSWGGAGAAGNRDGTPWQMTSPVLQDPRSSAVIHEAVMRICHVWAGAARCSLVVLYFRAVCYSQISPVIKFKQRLTAPAFGFE